MSGKGKYGGVSMIAVRERDGLEVNVGAAASYDIARSHAHLLLASTSAWERIYIRDSSGRRIATVVKHRPAA